MEQMAIGGHEIQEDEVHGFIIRGGVIDAFERSAEKENRFLDRVAVAMRYGDTGPDGGTVLVLFLEEGGKDAAARVTRHNAQGVELFAKLGNGFSKSFGLQGGDDAVGAQ